MARVVDGDGHQLSLALLGRVRVEERSREDLLSALAELLLESLRAMSEGAGEKGHDEPEAHA
jgi:hypothetical protein